MLFSRRYLNLLQSKLLHLVSFLFFLPGFLIYEKIKSSRSVFVPIFKGKSVAIVTPSATLEDMSLGSFIDKHDIVIKFNRMIDFPSQAKKDYGARCDILIHGLLQGDKPGFCGKVRPKHWLSKFPNLLVIYPFHLRPDIYKVLFAYFFRGGPLRALKAVDKKIYDQLAEMLDAKPTSGFVAVMLCANSEAKEINIFGMNHFESPHKKEYFGKVIHGLPVREFGHNQMAEKERLRLVIELDSRIQIY